MKPWRHRESNPRTSGLQRSASTTWSTACTPCADCNVLNPPMACTYSTNRIVLTIKHYVPPYCMLFFTFGFLKFHPFFYRNLSKFLKSAIFVQVTNFCAWFPHLGFAPYPSKFQPPPPPPPRIQCWKLCWLHSPSGYVMKHTHTHKYLTLLEINTTADYSDITSYGTLQAMFKRCWRS